MSSVNDCGDDQLQDRMYRINVSKSPEKRTQHESIVKRELVEGRSQRFFVDTEVQTLRESLQFYRRYKFRVIMPEANDHMEFSPDAGSRDLEMYKLFLKGACLLNFYKRPHLIENDVMIITSEGPDFKEDINLANSLFNINKDQRKFRLTGNEKTILDKIVELSGRTGDVTLKDIQENVKKPYSTVHTTIFGKNGVGGLVSKVPNMVIEDKSVKIDDTTTRIKVIHIGNNVTNLVTFGGDFARYF